MAGDTAGPIFGVTIPSGSPPCLRVLMTNHYIYRIHDIELHDQLYPNAGTRWNTTRQGLFSGSPSLSIQPIQQHAITYITFFGNNAFFNGFFYGAAGFIQVQTVVEMAIVDETGHFGEVMR